MKSISPSYIKKVREGLSLSQEEFGERVGSKGRSVSRWENGQGTPRAKAVIRKIHELAASLNMEVPDRAEIEIDVLRRENKELKARLSKLEKKGGKRGKKISVNQQPGS